MDLLEQRERATAIRAGVDATDDEVQWPSTIRTANGLHPGGVDGASDGAGSGGGVSNPNWTGVNLVLTVTDISLTIEQPPGTVIFSCSAAEDPNGLSSPVTLAC
jgi:hypothetical protein